MTKIIYVIPRLAYGGAERLLLDLCRKIDRRRFEVIVAVLKNDNPLQKQFEDAGVRLEFFCKKNKWDVKVLNRLVRFLKREKPDIVHTHLFGGDFWGGLAARMAKVPRVISTRHDMLYEGFWRNYLGRRERASFDKVVAISEATKEYLLKKEKIPFAKVKVIYNGIDTGKFYRENSLVLENEHLTIVSVGRLAKEKGHKHLIRACRFLQNEHWQLYLVGDGPLKKELKELVYFLGIGDKVHFAGEVDDVRPYLEKADIFALPSISEGLSLAVLEAALEGLFVIATNVGGVPEIVKDRETGLLFKPKNIEQLLSRLNWADTNRVEAQKMAKNLQRFVLQNFSINEVVRKYEELYLQVVSRQ